MRTEAAEDLVEIMEDTDSGAGWPFSLTNPSDEEADLIGFTNDIGQIVNLDTGMAVSGREATVALPISSFLTAFPGSELPRGIADESQKPWTLKFLDIVGEQHTFKVVEGRPDRAIGILVLTLEIYK